MQGLPARDQVTVVPQTVVVRHRHPPLGHGALRVLTGDLAKGLAGLFVLERMQQRDREIETVRKRFRAGRRKVHGPNLFLGERVMVIFLSHRIAPTQGNEQSKAESKVVSKSHKFSLSSDLLSHFAITGSRPTIHGAPWKQQAIQPL